MIFISCASKHVLRLCRHSYSARSNGVSKQDQPLDVATLLRHSDQKDENSLRKLKVSKSQKQILNFSFEPKNELKYFCITALASKSGRIKKI